MLELLPKEKKRRSHAAIRAELTENIWLKSIDYHKRSLSNTEV